MLDYPLFKKVVHRSLILSFAAIGLFLLPGITACQKEEAESTIDDTGICLVWIDGKFIEVSLDAQPEYLDGGETGFYQNLLDEINYPVEARENHIQGTCIVNYEVTEVGTVENIVAIQDPGGGIGESAIKTVATITSGISFQPGILNGSPVRVKKGISIKFRL